MATEQFQAAVTGELAALILDEIETEMVEYVDAATYALYLSMHFQKHSYMHDMRRQARLFSHAAGTVVEATATDPEIKQAYTWGGALALRVIEAYSPEVRDQLSRCRMVNLEDDPDFDDLEPAVKSHVITEMYHDFGEQGFGISGDYQTFIERLTDELRLGVDSQPYVRRGFGVVAKVFSQLMEARQDRETLQMVTALENDPQMADLKSFYDAFDEFDAK